MKQAAGFTTKYTKDTKVIPASVFLCVHLWLLTLLRFPFALIRVSSRLMNQTGFNAEDAESAESLATKSTKYAKQESESVIISVYQWLKIQKAFYTKAAKEAKQAGRVTTKYTKDTKGLGSVSISVHQWLNNLLLLPFAFFRVPSRLKNQNELNAEDAESAESLAKKGAKSSNNGSEFVSIRVHSWLKNLLLFPFASLCVPSRFICLFTALLFGSSPAFAAISTASTPKDTYFIQEYAVKGARSLPKIRIEEAVYPYLGPGRTAEDVESARAALEKAYADAGYQTVAVAVPPQNIAGGIVVLQVTERTVGRLRVRGARYSSPSQIKSLAPSVAEGKVINFTEVPPDMVALNQLPDRQITPSLHEGAAPNTVDVDLDVKEHSPLHASVEVNNRNGPNTRPLRVNASASVNNLAQTGHSLGFSFQTSPQAPSQVKVFSGYYLARAVGVDWLSLMVQGTKQDSNISTLGDTAVAGRGTTAGLRLLFALPAIDTYTQSATLGLDYKHFDQTIHLPASGSSAAATIITPITYYPLTAGYNGTWTEKKSTTEFNAGVTFHVRGLGSSSAQFDANRSNADGSFLYFHGDLSHTHELWAGFQIYAKISGQLADQALLSGEQLAGGGLGTVRGYKEGEQVGDSGLFGTLELRSPQLLHTLAGAKADWRIFVFTDGGWLKVIDALPGQKNHFDFASYGIGTRVQWTDYFSGAVNVGVPKLKEGDVLPGQTRVTFQGTLAY